MTTPRRHSQSQKQSPRPGTLYSRLRMRRHSTEVAGLPKGIDSLSTFAFEEPDGSTTVYFERDVCADEHSDIYRVSNANTA